MTTLTTRFDLDQQVWKFDIEQGRVKVVCETCNGRGKVTVGARDSSVYCPDCGAKGYEFIDERWKTFTLRPLTVGQIRALATISTDDPHTDADGNRVEYMCRETGVGSGTIHHEGDLFADSVEAETAARAQGAVARSEVDRVRRTEATE